MKKSPNKIKALDIRIAEWLNMKYYGSQLYIKKKDKK